MHQGTALRSHVSSETLRKAVSAGGALLATETLVHLHSFTLELTCFLALWWVAWKVCGLFAPKAS